METLKDFLDVFNHHELHIFASDLFLTTLNSKRIILTLNSEEVAKLTKIVFDDEKEETVSFLKEVLKPQVDQATRAQ